MAYLGTPTWCPEELANGLLGDTYVVPRGELDFETPTWCEKSSLGHFAVHLRGVTAQHVANTYAVWFGCGVITCVVASSQVAPTLHMHVFPIFTI